MSKLNNCLGFFVILLVGLHQTSSKCVPGTVYSVRLSENYTLIWTAAENPDNCSITSYVIYIKDLAEGTLELYSTPATVLNYNVSFLSLCSSYNIEVHALTKENVLGPAKSHAFTTAPTADINLNLTINSTTLKDNEMNVSWAIISPQVAKCVSYYRLVYWDEDKIPKDIYVSNTSHVIQGEVPCMTYEFQVRAIVGTPEIEGPFSLSTTSTYGQAPSPPKIASIQTTNTTATMIWNIDSYSQNRCEVLYLEIETLEPSQSALKVPYNDTTIGERPSVNVTMTNLIPDTVYQCNATVTNTAGTSANVSVVFQTANS